MKRLAPYAWLLFLLLPLAGCGKDDKPTAPGTTAEQDVQAGHAAIASGDYAAANLHYKNALLKNPSHPEANLGAAITEVYLVQNDPDVAALLDLVPTPLRQER